MPPKLLWTEARDTQIRRLRASGATWDVIAHALLLSRFTVIERGRRIGAHRPRLQTLAPPADDPDRPPLPAGHPRTWGPINRGTTLEGTPYPLPWFG